MALDGLDALPDQQLRRSIFEHPPSRITLETGVPAPHALDHAEGLHAAQVASEQARAAAGRHAGYSGSGM